MNTSFQYLLIYLNAVSACYISCSDIANILILTTVYFRFHLNNDMKDEELCFWTTGPNFVLVIPDKDDSKILGMIAMQKKSDDIAELNRLVVRPDARGQGLAKILVKNFIEETRRSGFKQIYLETTDAQKAARQLYEKFGFRKIGEIGLMFMRNSFISSDLHGLVVCQYLFSIS